MVGRLRTYMAVVAAIGFVVLCTLAANVDLGRLRANLPESTLLTLVVLTAPFLGIPLSELRTPLTTVRERPGQRGPGGGLRRPGAGALRPQPAAAPAGGGAPAGRGRREALGHVR